MTNLLTVQNISGQIKNMFGNFGYLSVRGELSNVKNSKGHIWYELLHLDHPSDLNSQKDHHQSSKKRDKISGVVWRDSINFETPPVDGQIVVIDAKFQLFGGRYYLNTRELLLDQDFKQLTQKKRYQELFSQFTPLFQQPKKNLPSSFTRVGLVTGSASDALHDIINISYRRDPTLHWIISTSLVQGSEAASQIILSVKKLVDYHRHINPLDAIVLSRGGGSSEDLWCFNDPLLIQYLATLEIPLITGIGHQADVTLADHIADLRMSTPSAVAERIASPLTTTLSYYHRNITDLIKKYTATLDSLLIETPPPPSPHMKAHTMLDLAKRNWTSALFQINNQLQNFSDTITPSATLAPRPLPAGTCRVTRYGRPFTKFETLKKGDRLRLHVVDPETNKTTTIFVKVSL